jgi:hypothetical protein
MLQKTSIFSNIAVKTSVLLKLYYASVVFKIMQFSPAHVDDDFTVAATFSGMR